MLTIMQKPVIGGALQKWLVPGILPEEQTEKLVEIEDGLPLNTPGGAPQSEEEPGGHLQR